MTISYSESFRIPRSTLVTIHRAIKFTHPNSPDADGWTHGPMTIAQMIRAKLLDDSSGTVNVTIRDLEGNQVTSDNNKWYVWIKKYVEYDD